MIRFSNTVDIARPPTEVFTYLADLERIPEWNWAITSTHKVSPGPVRKGTRLRQTRSVPRPAVEMLEVTDFERDRRIELVGELASIPAHLRYELVTAPDGGTQLLNTVELEPVGPLGLLGGLATGRIRAAVAENLEVMRSILEGG